MPTRIPFREFQEVFCTNIHTRSRTAAGTVDTRSSADKSKLLKQGEEVIAQAKSNIDALVLRVWEDAGVGVVEADSTRLRAMMESWYDIVNCRLHAANPYDEKVERLKREAESLRVRTGLPYRISRRYRVWDVDYGTTSVSPVELELAMDRFYEDLHKMIVRAVSGGVSQARLLAYADFTIDTAIHPWSDGCARLATAAVMWLSLLAPSFRLPRFDSREVHYSSIRQLVSHVEYYEKCLRAA